MLLEIRLGAQLKGITLQLDGKIFWVCCMAG